MLSSFDFLATAFITAWCSFSLFFFDYTETTRSQKQPGGARERKRDRLSKVVAAMMGLGRSVVTPK
jgi:hypothetical protein